MVKNFEEFVNESKLIGEVESSKETPDCLLKIVNFINLKTLKTNISKDGRVSSIKDEDDCINLLIFFLLEKLRQGKINLIFVISAKQLMNIEFVKAFII